jgi:class 3 adenylate cyclase/tetratricopeptide (TPR) repeat protein
MAQDDVKPQPTSQNPPATRERRYLTIVFSDLVGYTRLSEWMDLEDLLDLQLNYQREALTAMEDYGGYVASYSGDGVLVYFGYPTAHENDAERAVRASLELLRRVPTLKAKGPDGTSESLAVRIGVHTGLLAMDSEMLSMGRREYGIAGEAVNLAARLKDEAPVNSVVVTRNTLELVEGLFDTQPLGERPIRGLSRAIAVHKILGARHTAGRASGRMRRGATQMVGRQREAEALIAHWREAGQKSRRVMVQIVGEAGVGKTRLVQDFCQRPDVADGVIVRLNCLELFATTPLYAVAGFFWSRVGLSAEDDESTRDAKISSFLSRFDAKTPENVGLLANILGFVLKRADRTTAPTPLSVKKEQFAFLTELFKQIVRRHRAVILIEDAHWLDPSSAELLSEIGEHIVHEPVLVLLTARSFPKGPALPAPDFFIQLDQLDREDSLRLARVVPGAHTVSEELLVQATANCDGIPLFIEQMVLSLISQGQSGRLRATNDLPLTLAEIMSERLDRLEGSRRVVQTAACIGRAFRADFLGALLGDSNTQVIEPLEALVEAEILRRQHNAAQTTYEFRHALLQRIAYETIVQADRRKVHARIAGLMQQRSNFEPAIAEAKAHHLAEAGHNEEAIAAWLEAAALASRRSALIEAVAHIRSGLSLLGGIEEVERRRELELKLQMALMGPLTSTKGVTSDEFSACCERGMELCLSGTAAAMAFPFMFGQITFSIARGHKEEAISLAKRFIEVATRASNDPARVVGHRLAAMAYLHDGDLANARANGERSIELYSPAWSDAATQLFGQDIHVHSQSLLAIILFCVGEIDGALKLGLDSLRSAEKAQHAHSMVLALTYLGNVVGFCGATVPLMGIGRRLVAVSEQHGLTPFVTVAKGMLGWALCVCGDYDQGCAVLEEAIEGAVAGRNNLGLARYLTFLADARRRNGQLESARVAAARAVDVIASDSKWFESEVYRTSALVARDLDPQNPQSAQALLERAAGCARQIGAPVFELRALLDLKSLSRPPADTSDLDTRIAELGRFRDIDRRVEQIVRAHTPGLFPAAS